MRNFKKIWLVKKIFRLNAKISSRSYFTGGKKAGKKWEITGKTTPMEGIN